MEQLKFPIMLWRDAADNWFGCWIEDSSTGVAIGASPRDVLDQLDVHLTRRAEREPWMPRPEVKNPELLSIRIDVRPEYREDKRVYPCTETVAIRLPCLRAKDESGMWACYIPTLKLNFRFHNESDFKKLTTYYAQDRLSGLTPRELARFLPPEEVLLDEIIVRLREEAEWRETEDQHPLSAILDAVTGKRLQGTPLRCWERDAEVADLAARLSAERAHVVIIGRPGTGKSSVLLESIRQVLQKQKNSTDVTQVKREFYRTSAARLISGMRYLGQWEQRCEQVVEFLQQKNGALCIENLLDLLSAGGEPSSSVAAFFAPFMERGDLQLIAEASPEEFDACRRLLPGFADLFQTLRLPEFTSAQAIRIVDKTAQTLARNLHVEVAAEVAPSICRLFARFQPYRAFPGPAVAFVDELVRRAKRERNTLVATDTALSLFTRRTGLPETLLRDDIPLTREQVLAPLRAKVIGQDDACAAIAGVMLAFKAGLNDPRRPLGVLLFCGPTGVGKTELAKSLARGLFENGAEKDRLIRLDMSEFSGPDAVYRLIGDVASGPGQLAKRVRQQPFSVLLLDEVEKADPGVFDVLLRVFDEGHLTDVLGRPTFFTSCVIVMTSNLGANVLAPMGFARGRVTAYEHEAMGFFRPEFVNRIDAIVPFSPLNEASIRIIVEKELRDLASREGLSQRSLRLTWTPDVIALLAKRGFDARYGARPLQRVLEELIVNPISAFLLKNSATRDRDLQLECIGNVIHVL